MRCDVVGLLCGFRLVVLGSCEFCFLDIVIVAFVKAEVCCVCWAYLLLHYSKDLHLLVMGFICGGLVGFRIGSCGDGCCFTCLEWSCVCLLAGCVRYWWRFCLLLCDYVSGACVSVFVVYLVVCGWGVCWVVVVVMLSFGGFVFDDAFGRFWIDRVDWFLDNWGVAL